MIIVKSEYNFVEFHGSDSQRRIFLNWPQDSENDYIEERGEIKRKYFSLGFKTVGELVTSRLP